jgi:hypothetical protein
MFSEEVIERIGRLRALCLPEDYKDFLLNVGNDPDTRHIAGTLCVCHQGCGDFSLLVVKGQESGHVWLDARGNFSGIVPENRTFSQWYLDWLDEYLKKAMP